ncbi:hypothetical protein HPB52_023208 [Rhipicephalus sanguineus]|uniref:Peptidase M13 C-terminal domain-containing protein n=1 Tax=Rhipicephalus sanguineus TaxID=34632 RepID=A0A9D4QEY2_RHISA|nr:hypothetical protein HPB52_023208 [Rhipicephalus sanguineus]
MEKKMKKTERKVSTRLAPASEEPAQAIIRYPSCSTEPQPPAGVTAQPSSARDKVDTNEANNVLLDVARLVDKNISEAEQRQAARQRWSTHRKAAIVSLIALLVSALLIAALVIWQEFYAGGRGPGPTCDTNDCLRFAFIVTQSMDRGADACDAFGTFVCGASRRPQLPSWTPEARDYLLYSVDSIGWWLPLGDADHPSSPSTGSPESNCSSATTSAREGDNANEEVGDMSASDFDKYVFSTLSKLASAYSAGLEPSAIDLMDMDALTPNLESSLWIASLQKHMGSTMNISGTTQVLVADRRLLTTADHFFDKFFHAELLDHMSRCIVNAFSNAIYSAASAEDAGIEPNKSMLCPSSAVRARCELQVEFTYRLPLAVNYILCNEMAARQERLLAILNEALRAAVASLVRIKNPKPSGRMYGSIDATINRLQRLNLDVWPSDEVIRKSHDDLDQMYASFPKLVASRSYLEHVFGTRRVLRSLLGSASYPAMMGIGSHGTRSRDGFFCYDPFANAVSVWPGSMQEPLFFVGGTNAMNYGGVGVTFARQLTAAMDVDEVLFDNGAGQWLVHHRDRANITEDDIVAEQRALGIAYDAFVAHMLFNKSGTRGQHVVSLEEFSPEQIFFVSYCHSQCQLLPTRGQQRCASTVKGFKYFRDAFRCTTEKRIARRL